MLYNNSYYKDEGDKCQEKKNARSERTGRLLLSGEEAAFTFLWKSHGQAFESALQMPNAQKRPIRKDWSFCDSYRLNAHFEIVRIKAIKDISPGVDPTGDKTCTGCDHLRTDICDGRGVEWHSAFA